MAEGKKQKVVRKCDVDGCEKPHYGLGKCQMHYTQIRKYGVIKESVKRDPICVVPGCNAKHYSNGYCNRHNKQMKQYGQIVRTMYDPNSFEFKDNICLIGIFKRSNEDVVKAIIDFSDYDLVKDRKWFLKKGNSGDYVVSGHRGSYVTLSRLITGAKEGEEVDHKKHNLLDNRRSKLRVCTKSQNQCNSLLRKDNMSGVKGVFWHTKEKKWRAEIQKNSVRFPLGRFNSLEEAKEAVNKARIELHKEYACEG